MGYRLYLGVLPNDKVDVIRDMEDIEEVKRVLLSWGRDIDDDDTPRARHITDRVIDQVGDISIDKNSTLSRIPLFSNEKIQSHMNEDGDLFVLDKEELYKLINLYRAEVFKYISELENSIKETDDRVLSYLKFKKLDWEKGGPLCLTEGSEKISLSWSYEYGIFDLGYLWKTFDFSKETLILYGY